MSEKPSHSRIRIALAQFMVAHDVDLQDLYDAIGVDTAQCAEGPLSHIAGVIDGMSLAVKRIKERGIDDWAKE